MLRYLCGSQPSRRQPASGMIGEARKWFAPSPASQWSTVCFDGASFLFERHTSCGEARDEGAPFANPSRERLGRNDPDRVTCRSKTSECLDLERWTIFGK